MRSMIRAAALLAVCVAAAAFASNEQTVIVVHADDDWTVPACEVPNPCASGGVANTMVQTSGWTGSIRVFMRNFDELAGVQFAISLPTEWSQPDFANVFSCTDGNFPVLTPTPPWRGLEGEALVAFDCVQGGDVLEIISLVWSTPLVATEGTCFEIDNVSRSGTPGVFVADCMAIQTPIMFLEWGTVCAGIHGWDVCVPVMPLEPTTWGSIKARHRP